jgi:hypothetical protein
LSKWYIIWCNLGVGLVRKHDCGTGRKAYVDGLKHDITLRKLIQISFGDH